MPGLRAWNGTILRFGTPESYLSGLRHADSLINSGNPHYGPYWDVAAVDCGYMSKDMSAKILWIYAAVDPTAPEKDTLRRIATF